MQLDLEKMYAFSFYSWTPRFWHVVHSCLISVICSALGWYDYEFLKRSSSSRLDPFGFRVYRKMNALGDEFMHAIDQKWVAQLCRSNVWLASYLGQPLSKQSLQSFDCLPITLAFEKMHTWNLFLILRYPQGRIRFSICCFYCKNSEVSIYCSLSLTYWTQ